jgi:hypothetical protein
VEKNDDVQLADGFDHQTAKALATLVYDVIRDPEKRAAFREHPIDTARDAGVRITEKTTRVIMAVHNLSDDELPHVLTLNDSLIRDGVYVETGNPPLMVF